ncbi:hypothetical protein KIPB_009642, partial [Kipferlia bialata]
TALCCCPCLRYLCPLVVGWLCWVSDRHMKAFDAIGRTASCRTLVTHMCVGGDSLSLMSPVSTGSGQAAFECHGCVIFVGHVIATVCAGGFRYDVSGRFLEPSEAMVPSLSDPPMWPLQLLLIGHRVQTTLMSCSESFN